MNMISDLHNGQGKYKSILPFVMVFKLVKGEFLQIFLNALIHTHISHIHDPSKQERFRNDTRLSPESERRSCVEVKLCADYDYTQELIYSLTLQFTNLL